MVFISYEVKGLLVVFVVGAYLMALGVSYLSSRLTPSVFGWVLVANICTYLWALGACGRVFGDFGMLMFALISFVGYKTLPLLHASMAEKREREKQKEWDELTK
ncbi:MAG TPA: hypothetical protein VLA04_05725 [Verrucomicrobiae bacterium]|nr:hypothetical protein [Verrucomicrobiae bacterium]